jgi:hypothetical protein
MKEIFGDINFWFAALCLIASTVIFTKRIFLHFKGTRLTATVVEIEPGRGGAWFPVVEFEYEGQKMKMSTGVGTGKEKIEIGKTYDIIYHPSFKKYVIQVGNKKDILFGFGILLGGAALLVIFLLRYNGIDLRSGDVFPWFNNDGT